MDYRGHEILEERLREAILNGDINEVQSLLKRKAFRMLGEEMDDLLKQLGVKGLQALQEKMSREKKHIDVLSKAAQLKHVVEWNDIAHIHPILGQQKCGSSEYHLKASTIASVAMHAMRASSQPNCAIIELLIKRACDVEPRMWDSAVALPILYCVLSELPARLRKKLLQLPEAKSRSVPVALLQLAVKSGNISVVEEIISDPDLDIRVDDIYVGDSHRATALMRASHHGHVDMVAYLISCGADMKKRDRNGRTALHQASAQGHEKVVRLLLPRPEEIIRDPVRFASVLAVRRRRRQARQDEEEFEEEEEMVQQQQITTVANSSVVEEVIRSSMEYVDGVDEWGMTALHLAVCDGHVEVVKLLLDACADPSLRAPHQSSQSQSQSKFTFFVDTYLTVCRKEVMDYEKLYMHPTTSKENKQKGKVVESNLERLPRNDCFRLSPVMSVYWHPGGFTALHFAVAYAARRRNGDAVLESLLLSVHSENLRRLKDSNGLTALDWAMGLDDGHPARSKMIESLKFEGESAVVVVDCLMRSKVSGYMQVLGRMEERKKEAEWGDMIGWALRNGEFVAAEALAKEYRNAVKQQSLSDDTINHLKWAAHEPSLAIWEEWEWEKRTRKFVMAQKGWARKVERVLVEMMMPVAVAREEEEEAAAPEVPSAVPVMEATDAQQFLVWAIKKGMADLAMVLTKNKECQLVEPLRGGKESIAPLDAAAAWRKRVWEIEPVLHAMEARNDVRESVLQKRELYVSFLNALLVASVLIGGLAFSAILQPTSSVRNTLEVWNSGGSSPGTAMYGRWRLMAPPPPTTAEAAAAAAATANNNNSSSSSSRRRHGQRQQRLVRSSSITSTTTSAAAVTASPRAESASTTTEESGAQNRGLADIFIWSTHISFFCAIIATFEGINGAIPPSKGDLAFSQSRIQRSIWMATMFTVAAVIAITFSFGSAILDVVNKHYKERGQLKGLAIAVGTVGSIVLIWIVIRLMQTWEAAREIELQAARKFPEDKNSLWSRSRWKRIVGLGIVFCMLALLEVFHVFLRSSWQDKIEKLTLRLARKMCGEWTADAVVYKSLRTLGVSHTHGEEKE